MGEADVIESNWGGTYSNRSGVAGEGDASTETRGPRKEQSHKDAKSVSGKGKCKCKGPEAGKHQAGPERRSVSGEVRWEGSGQGGTCRADAWTWVTVKGGLIECQGGRVQDPIFVFPGPLWLWLEEWKEGAGEWSREIREEAGAAQRKQTYLESGPDRSG